jgi:DNA-binding Lrp family transcriptional regulator
VGFVLGIVTLPPLELVLEVGALLEKRALPKAIMSVLAMLALIVGGIFASIAFASTEEGSAWVMGCLFAPFVFLFSIPAIVVLPKIPDEWLSVAQLDREERAVALIKSHGGTATYEELSQALGLSEEDVDALLLDLIRSGKLLGAREVPYKRFYTAIALEEKRRQILGRVEARGQVSLDVLATELDAPVALVQEWIYRLVQSRKFTGYINWDEGILYSADAEGLRDGGRCPYCGGELGLAGKGVVRCHNCGSEIFL